MIGVDIVHKVIEKCIESYGSQPKEKLSFINANYVDIKFPEESFDIITSIHTMEHIQDDVDFLRHCKLWLRKKGYIVLEVPLLMKRPFAYSSEPLNPFHIREYSLKGLIKFMSSFFDIIKVYGVTRGQYVSPEKSRNAVLIIAQKSN